MTEPSAYDYGRFIDDFNRSLSDDYFTVVHNNCGFLGYYITTPKDRYILVKSSVWSVEEYTLHEYVNRAFDYGKSITDETFGSLEEAKAYIKEIEQA